MEPVAADDRNSTVAMSDTKGRFRSGVRELFSAAKKTAQEVTNDLSYESRKMYVLLFGNTNPGKKGEGKYKDIDLPGTGYKLRMYYSAPAPSMPVSLQVGKLELWDAVVDLARPYKTSPETVASSKNPIALPALISIKFPRAKLSIQKGIIPASIQVLMEMKAGMVMGNPAPIMMAPSETPRTETPAGGNVLAMIRQYFIATPGAAHDPVAMAFNSMVKQGLERMKSDLFNPKKDLWLVEHGRRAAPHPPHPALPSRSVAGTPPGIVSSKPTYSNGNRPVSEMGTAPTQAASSKGVVAGTAVPALNQQSMYYVLMREFMRAALEAAIAKRNKEQDGSALIAIGAEIGGERHDVPVLDEDKGALYEDSSREIKLGIFHTIAGDDGEMIAGIFDKFTKKGRENKRVQNATIRKRRYYLIVSTDKSTQIGNKFTVHRKLITPPNRPKWTHANFTINDASDRPLKSGTTPALISIDSFPVSSSKFGRKASAKDAVRVLIYNTSNTRLVLTGGPAARSDLIANVLLKEIIARAKDKKKNKDKTPDSEEWFIQEAERVALEKKGKSGEVEIKEQISYASPVFSALDGL